MRTKKGEIIEDKGYSFSSTVEGCATPCNGIRDLGTPEVRLKITIPKGARVSNGERFSQCEILFPRNAKYRITSPATEKDKGVYEILLEYVIPER